MAEAKVPEVKNDPHQSQNICFTKFFKPENLEAERPKWDEDLMRYLCYQVEIAPQTGNYHFQGFCVFYKKKTAQGAAKVLGVGWGNGDYTKAARDRTAAMNYCSKKDTAVEGSFREFGSRPKGGRGERADLAAVLACKNVTEAALLYPTITTLYARGLESVFLHRQLPRNEKPEVRVYWGPSGSGKTHQAMEDGGNSCYNISAGADGKGLKWWPKYYQQDCCVIDEFRGDCCNFNFLLKLLDGTPLTLETKGGHVEFNSPLIIITSTQAPEEWYNDRWEELERRITEIRKFKHAPGRQNEKPLRTEQQRHQY